MIDEEPLGDANAPNDRRPRRWRRWLNPRTILRALGKLGFLTLIGGSLLVWSARWFWLGEVAASFAWYLGLAGGAGTGLLLLIRCPRMAVVAAVLAALQLWPELSLWLPDSRSGALDEPGEELTVVSSNLLWDNLDHAGLADLIERTSPDVVVFLEVSPRWREAIEELRDEYPHQLFSPEEEWGEETWGKAIVSRRPWLESRLIPLPGGMTSPSMEVIIELDGEPVTIRGAHPVRPGKSWRNERRDSLLDSLATLDWSGNALLLGDLNVTSTSPVFGRLLETSGLRDSRRGFGRQPSWQTRVLIPGLRIAIDHVLVSDSIHMLERRVEPLSGSDHRSVVAKVTLHRE